MSRFSEKIIDINVLFRLVNIFLFIITMVIYSFWGFPSLVDEFGLIAFALLEIQVLFFLLFERKSRNSLLLVYIFVLTFFYFPRLITIHFWDYYSYSQVLERIIKPEPEHISFSLYFIFFANFFIFLGLYVPKIVFKKNRMMSLEGKVKNLNLLSLAILAFLFSFLLNFIKIESLNVFLIFLTILFNREFILSIAVLSLLFSYKNRSISLQKVSNYRYWNFIWVLLIVGYLILRILEGSRSGILSLLLYLLFSFLSLEINVFSRKIVKYVMLLIFMGALIFPIATRFRTITIALDSKMSIDVKIEKYLTSFSEIDWNQIDFRPFIGVFDRTSFLDMSTDLIKNSEYYQGVINPYHYFMSTIDNVTPGFDVYDAPKAANALIHYYRNAPLKRIHNFGYQSDMLTIFGEYYVLFGLLLSMLFFFIGAFIFQICYLLANELTIIKGAILKTFILYYFYNWINSFGFDWFIIDFLRDAISFYFIYFIVTKFVLIKKVGKSSVEKVPAIDY